MGGEGMGQWGPAVLSIGVAVKMWGWWPGAGFGHGGLVFKDGVSSNERHTV